MLIKATGEFYDYMSRRGMKENEVTDVPDDFGQRMINIGVAVEVEKTETEEKPKRTRKAKE